MPDPSGDSPGERKAEIYRLDNVHLSSGRERATPYYLTIFLWPDLLQWRIRFDDIDHKVTPDEIVMVRIDWVRGFLDPLFFLGYLVAILGWYGGTHQDWPTFWVITGGAILLQFINWRRLRLRIETLSSTLRYTEPWRVWGRRGTTPTEVAAGLIAWCERHQIPVER